MAKLLIKAVEGRKEFEKKVEVLSKAARDSIGVFSKRQDKTVEDKQFIKDMEELSAQLDAYLKGNTTQRQAMIKDIPGKLDVVSGEILRRGIKEFGGTPRSGASLEALLSQLEVLIEKREQARKKKEWNKADDLRRQLRDMGVEVVDTKGGPVWRRAARRG